MRRYRRQPHDGREWPWTGMNELVGRWPGAWVSDDPAGAEAEKAREREALLVEVAPLAYRVALAVLRHHQDAEDVAQEALAQAWSRFHTLRDRDRLRSWLARIAWRRALDRRRAERRREKYEGMAPVPGGDAEAAMAARERQERVWAEVDRLPEKLRIVVVLASLFGHDLREVGRLLRLPEGTVKSRLFHARRALAERLR
jgi:RNA polymerase sigma-70 factor (ECF subfamily)